MVTFHRWGEWAVVCYHRLPIRLRFDGNFNTVNHLRAIEQQLRGFEFCDHLGKMVEAECWRLVAHPVYRHDLDQIDELIADFYWQLNEECFVYNECDRLLAFIAAAKPVFHVEYQGNSDSQKVCQYSAQHGLSTLFKKLKRDDWFETCATPRP